jgi:hypothetical protein
VPVCPRNIPSARQQVARHGAVKHQDKNKTNLPSILLRNWQKVCCLRLNKLRAGRSANLVSILFQRGSWSGRQADYVPPSSAGLRELEIRLHSPHTSYSRGTSLSTKDNFTFTFTNFALHLFHGALPPPRALYPLNFTFIRSFHLAQRYELKHSQTASCFIL